MDFSQGHYAYCVGSAFESSAKSTDNGLPTPVEVRDKTWLVYFSLPKQVPNWKKKKRTKTIVFVADSSESLPAWLSKITSCPDTRDALIYHVVVLQTSGKSTIEVDAQLSDYPLGVLALVSQCLKLSTKEKNLSGLVELMILVTLQKELPILRNCSLPDSLRQQRVGCYDTVELFNYISQVPEVESILFVNDACLTDVFFKMCDNFKKDKMAKLKRVAIMNCPRITDNGLYWLAQLVNVDTQVTIADCPKVTELGLSYIQYEMGIQVDTLEGEKETAKQNQEHLALVCPPMDLNISVASLIRRGTSIEDPNVQKQAAFSYIKKAKMGESTWNLLELPLSHPLFESVAPRRVSQVIIPVDFAKSKEESVQHVSQVITNVIAKDQSLPPIMKELPVSKSITCARLEGIEEVEGDFKYTFNSNVALFIANEKICKDLNYFEIEVVDTGRSGTITMGCVSASHRSNRQPGWERNSVAYHLDDGSLFDRESGSSNSTASSSKVGRPGDIVACQVLRPFDEKGNLKLNVPVDIQFLKNGNLMHESRFTFSAQPYPAVGMHSRGEIFRFKTPKFKRPPLMRRVELLDGNYLRSTGGGMGQYIGIVPLEVNDYFEFEILNIDMQHHAITIGAVSKSHSESDQPGWRRNSIGLHADDRKCFRGGGSFVPNYPENLAGKDFAVGDKMGCGLRHFDVPNGQNVLCIYFTWSGSIVVKVPREEVAPPDVPLFPFINPGLHSNNESGVKITRPFLSSKDGPSHAGAIPPELVKASPSQILYWGTPFQIAGVGKGTLNDLMEIYTQAVNKVQQTHAGLLKQMTAYSDGLMSGKISVKKFSLLQEFCTLSVQLDRFSRFLGAQKDIVKHVCLDEKGLPEMFNGLLICQKIKDFVSPWQTDSKEQKIVQRYARVNAGGIADDSWKNIHGIHHKVLKDLHSQGIILYLSQLPEPIVILNIEVFAAVMNKALNCSTPVPMSTPVLYLPDGQKVYTCQNLKEAVTSIDSAIDDKNFQILYKMINDLGILQQAKSFRTSLTPEDWTYLFFNCRTVQQPSIPLEDFNCPPNAPVIKKTQTYTYPAGFHRDLLPAIFAACEQFVSPEIVWAQGFLCRHDGIEVMVNETITGVGTGMITLSGQSYRPEDERAKAEMERSILLEMYIYGMVIDSVLGETQTLAFRQGDLSELLDIKVDPCLCQEHVWSRPDGTYPWDYKVTVCTRCNNCSDKGITCPWNGIKERRLSSGEVWASSLKQLDSGQETCHLGTEWHLPVMFENLEECGCDTEIRACRRCGLCRHCAYVLGTIHARVDPGYGSLMNNLVTHEAAMTTYRCEYPLDGTVHQIVNISAMKYLNQDFQGIVLLTSFLQDKELKLLIGEGGTVTLMVGQQADYPAASYGLLRSLEKGDVLTLKVTVYPGSMERFDQNGVTKLIDEDASVVLPMYLQVILNGVCLNTYMIPNLEWYPTLVTQGQQAGEFRGWNFECPTMPLVIRSSFPGGSVPTLTALDEEEDCYVYNCSVDESPRGTVVSFRKEEDPFLSYCIIKIPLAGLDPANFMEVEFQDVDICGKFYMGPIWFSDAEVEAMDFRETVSYVLSVWDDEKLKRSLDCGDRVSVVVDIDSVQNVSAENTEVRVTWELPAGRSIVTTLPLYNQPEPGVKGRVHMAILFQKNPEFPSPKGPTVRVTKFGNLDYNLLPAPVKTLSCRRVDPGDRTEIALTYSSGTMTANDTPLGTWLLLPELTEAVLKKVTLKKLLEFGNLTAMLACQNTRPAWIHPRGYPRYPAHFHLIDMAPQKVKTSAEAVLMFENMLMNRIYRGLAQRKVSLPLLDSTNPQEREKIEYLFQERYLSFCAAICRHVWKGGFTSERQAAVPWIKELSETYGDLQAGLMENHNHGCREIHDKPDEVFKGPHVSLKQGENLEKFKFDKNRGTEYAVAVVLQKTDTDLEKIPVQSEDLSTLYLTCGQPSWFEPSTYSDGNLELTTQLPSTWKMKNLAKFCVNGLITTSQNVSSMECKNLTVVDVSESLVETLPDFRVLPKVREVNASHCMVTIQSLTSCHIDQLKYLVSLSLDELLLDSLPRSFGQLKTLQYLSIKGIPWLRGDEDPQCGQAETSGLSNSVAKVAARTSCIESPNELLKKYDYDNNDILNVKEEIPGLNTELFMSVPRLGQTFKDADSSGIPLAVFEMENLRELRLANQGINSVPQTIAKLKRLRVLELSNNPLLESVAGEVAFLPIRDNVSQGLKLDGCPSLKSPPNDIVGRGGGAVISFLKRVAGGFTVCRRTKLMFVGLGGAGKTSLLRALMSGNYKTKSLGAKEVTDGIDIKAWTVKKNDGPEVTFSTWDFAGQKVYYNTHQFFLSSRAVYLLLWTTRSGYEHAGLEFWLSSIASHAPGAPVFVIGTRADEVDKPEIPMEKLQKKFPQIAGFHFISSLTGQGIRVLEDRLVDVTLAQKYMGEQIPTVWLKLETAILTMKEKKKVSIVKWEEIAAMANEVGIYEEDDLKEAIQFLTYLGSVQYFDNEFLRKYVVINPQWIADVMACVVSIKANAIKDGRLNHSDIGVIWKAYDKEYHEWLLMLTQEFDLTFPLPDQKVNLVPCLLPGEEPKYDWPDLEADSGIRETRMLYQFTYLPTGLFNRAQVRLFQFTDGKAIWKEGSFLKKNAHIALIKQTRENELSVKVQGPEPENVLLLIHEVFEGLIAEAYHGVTYTYLVQCPDCVNKQRTHDPFLFPNNLIRQASNHAGAFLQCHRFFHSISLNELEAIMPPDSKSDLDMQLENSIRKLRDMRKNNSTDILVSYCAANLTENAANPIKVVQDINNMGYTCWFDEDIGTKTLSDFIVPLKDSKLLLAMVSKEYAEDEKCKELFQYASQKLKKPYVIVTITKSFDWTKSELGMNIGLQEIFVDLSKEDVYDTKLDELKEKLKSKLEEEEKKEQDAVDVFISYCWSNSHDAVKKGTAEKDGALGWEKGDPREIRSYLESQGVRCWLDIEQAGKTGLFEDISEGLKKAKVVVACVSDEYANSPNCMMELRFAMLNLRKPLVACVVGTKSEWETSEVSILLMRGRASDTSKKNTLPPKFNFQQNLKEYPPMFLKEIQDRIAQVKEEMEKKEAVKAQPAEAADHTPAAEKRQKQEKIVSFQEEFELIQRKLMRFIEVHHAINLDIMPYPKLCVLDYVDLEGHAEAVKKSMVNLQPPVSEPDDQTGQQRKLVCKILCEYEQGWHLSGPPILLKLKDQEKFIADSAAYLARMNAVLKHSGVNLTCMGGSDEALEFVRDIELKGTDTSGFAKAFKHFREEVMKNDVHKVRGHLKRCLLPSGKIRWLCPKHADGPRITILNSDLATAKDAVLPYSKCDEETMQLIKADSKYEQTVQARQTQGQDAASALKITAQDLQAPRIAEHVTINGPASPKKLEKKKSTRKMKATQAAARVAGSYAKAKKNNSVAQESNGQAPAQAPAQAQGEGNGEKKSKACVIM